MNCMFNSTKNKFNYKNRQIKLLEQIKLLLGSKLNEKMNIPKEVKKFGIGYESFRKYFTIEYGISPKAYRISRRLDKADVLFITH